MQFNVNVQRADGVGGLNLNVSVDAPDVLQALEVAKAQLAKTLDASGLQVTPVAPSAAPAQPAAAPATGS